MANHRTPRGEESTYRSRGGKQTFPYSGKHRAEDGVKGYKMGTRDDKARREIDKGDYKREQ